jgi:hypothetical protein
MNPVLQGTFARNLVGAALPLPLTDAETANTMCIGSAQYLAAIQIRVLGRDTNVSNAQQEGMQLHQHSKKHDHHE